MREADVSLTVRYGESSNTMVVAVDAAVARELMERLGLSSDPSSLIKTAQTMIRLLVVAFGVNEESSDCRVAHISQHERKHHEREGQLPRGDALGKL